MLGQPVHTADIGGGDNIKSAGDRFQLQGNIGSDTDQGKECDQSPEADRFTVTAGDKVGHTDNLVGFADAHQLAHREPPAKSDQGRTDIDRQEVEPGGGSAADAAVISPGGEIDRQRKGVDVAIIDNALAKALSFLRIKRHDKEQTDIKESQSDNKAGREHQLLLVLVKILVIGVISGEDKDHEDREGPADEKVEEEEGDAGNQDGLGKNFHKGVVDQDDPEKEKEPPGFS